jgi:hypothetical protein
MKKLSLFMALALIVMAGSTQAYELRDSADFVITLDQIEGDVMPGTLSTWDDFSGMDDATILNGDGTMTTAIDNTAWFAWGANSPVLNSMDGWTFEMNIRVDAQATETGAVLDILNRDNTGANISPWISIHRNGIGHRIISYGRTVLWPVDLTTDFHTVRVAYDPDDGISLWVDNQLVTDTVLNDNYHSSSMIRIAGGR